MFKFSRFYCIYRCSVFVSSKSLNDGQTTKLKRDEATVVYDFHKYFLPNLEKYIHGTGPKPSAEVTIGFGQRFLPERESVSNLLISGSLVHTEAYHLITTVSYPGLEVMKLFSCSKSTEHEIYSVQ